ncbi:MAG: response regulator [Clostridia bacterium]|nr:response regulator [Clostridia bacterium]
MTDNRSKMTDDSMSGSSSDGEKCSRNRGTLGQGSDTGVPVEDRRKKSITHHFELVRDTVDLKGRRILLAEDVAVNAEIMIMVLSMREIEVEHAENGRIAVEMYTGHDPGYYDAILMDMRMPEMDGLQATETIPIIALTANTFDEDVQHSMQAVLNAHLSKPVEPEQLFKTLESLI